MTNDGYLFSSYLLKTAIKEFKIESMTVINLETFSFLELNVLTEVKCVISF